MKYIITWTVLMMTQSPEPITKEFSRELRSKAKAHKIYEKGLEEIKNDTLDIYTMGYSKIKTIKLDSIKL